MSDFSNQTPIFEPLTERELEILRLLADGLSNQEVAQELVISVGTVKWHNRQIYSKLYVNSRTQAIARAQEYGLLDFQSDTITPSISPPKHNLPTQITSFIGRKRQIGEIKTYFQATRLLTITGPGGTGKTRLALQVASDLLDAYPDGVYFVSLASLSDPSLVASAIADVLNIPETPNQPLIDTLKSYFRNQNMLLILDNFEHVLTATPLVTELLETSPNLRILATSREILRLSGEQEYVLPPLALPNISRQDNIATLLKCESVALFVQRARRVRPDFEITEENANIIAEICTRLDGLPLVIELAAARSKLLTPQAMLARLDSRLDVLTEGMRNLPARQQTLRNTLDWSYDLLNKDERILFARLAVFRSGCTLEAIEAICSGNLTSNIFDGLASLVDKSLIRQMEGHVGELRFWMLETIHEYAWEQLEANREANTIRDSHTTYYLEAIHQREAEIKGGRQLEALSEIESDFENVRAGWHRAVQQQDADIINRSLETLYWFTEMQSRQQEGRDLFRHARLTLSALGEEEPPSVWGRLLVRYHDKDDAANTIETALALAKRYDDQVEVAHCLRALGYLAHNVGDYHTALSYFDKSFTGYHNLDDRFYMARNLDDLYVCNLLIGQIDKATQFAEQQLNLTREIGDKIGLANAFNSLGALQWYAGNYSEAEVTFEEATTLAQEMGDQKTYALNISALGWMKCFRGDFEAGRILAKEAHKVSSDVNDLNIVGATQIMLALVASMAEEYSHSREICESARLVISNPEHLALADWTLSIATVGMQDFETAIYYNQAYLQYGTNLQSVSVWALGLPVAVVILAHQGERQHAVEVLALAFTHPASATEWMEKWSFLTRLRVELEAELGTETYDAAWEQGQALNLETVIMALLIGYEDRLTGNTDSP